MKKSPSAPNDTYNDEWLTACHLIKEQLQYETPPDPFFEPKDRLSAFQHMALLYVKYIQIFKKVEDSYDNVVHPQKRRIIRDTLDSIMGRLLEIKHKINELESVEFFSLEDFAQDLKLHPLDLEIPIPHYFKEENLKLKEERKNILISRGAKIFDEKKALEPISNMTLQEAIKIIQINERGRQGKLRARFMKEIREQEERERRMLQGTESDVNIEDAALTIQKIYKGYRARQQYKKLTHDELNFLGMAQSELQGKHTARGHLESIRNRRKVLQQKFEEDYQDALISIKQKLQEVEAPDIKETFLDNFRTWYMEKKKQTDKLPDFPSDEDFMKENFRFGEPSKDQEKEAKPESVEPAMDEGSKQNADNSGKKSDKKKKEPETDEEAPKFKLDESIFLDTLKRSVDNYNVVWKTRDESENFAQRHDSELIKQEKRMEVEREVKLQIIDLLKEELVNLKATLEKEKGKKGKGKKGGKKKGKKDKKGGKKKGKKEKDLTGGKPIPEMFEELIQNGIAKRSYPGSLNEFQGDFNLMAPIINNVNPKKGFIPSQAEIRRLISEYCLLPIGFPATEDKVLPTVKSILLYGPHGSGKSMLVNAVVNELGATLFDISPKNTAGLYIGKPNVSKMLYMVFKCAKTYAPSVIYIEDAEMIFAKKVPKDDTSDPKRIKKDIGKYIKALQPFDRVMVIGNSYKPWDILAYNYFFLSDSLIFKQADLKGLLGTFQKGLLIPRLDYSSRQILWDYALVKFGGRSIYENAHVDTTLLARISDGFTAGTICSAVRGVLTDRRRKQLKERPLQTAELAEQLTRLDPVFQEQDDLLMTFVEKLPVNKKRTELLNPVENVEGEGKQEKSKKKK